MADRGHVRNWLVVKVYSGVSINGPDWSTRYQGLSAGMAMCGVGALLQVLVANRDVEDGKLGVLVLFGLTIVEKDGPVFFQR